MVKKKSQLFEGLCHQILYEMVWPTISPGSKQWKWLHNFLPTQRKTSYFKYLSPWSKNRDEIKLCCRMGLQKVSSNENIGIWILTNQRWESRNFSASNILHPLIPGNYRRSRWWDTMAGKMPKRYWNGKQSEKNNIFNQPEIRNAIGAEWKTGFVCFKCDERDFDLSKS